MNAVMNTKNIKEDSTTTVIDFVENVCLPRSTFLPSKKYSNSLSLGIVQPYFCLSVGNTLADMYSSGDSKGVN